MRYGIQLVKGIGMWVIKPNGATLGQLYWPIMAKNSLKAELTAVGSFILWMAEHNFHHIAIISHCEYGATSSFSF